MRIAYIILFLVLSFTGISQKKAERLEIAKTQIKELKEGALLVRLQTKQKVIDALLEKGYPKRANHIEKTQKEKNIEISGAFKDFDFCPVYFFYSQYSDSLKYGNYAHVILLDDSLKEVEVELTNFHIADFGNVKKSYENDTTDAKRNELKNKGREATKTYKGGSSLNIRAMVLSDSKFKQLKSPFPFYVRFHPTPLHDLTYPEVVEKMNENLSLFYNKMY